MLARKEYDEAERLFDAVVKEGPQPPKISS
jgi:hypothetical protein